MHTTFPISGHSLQLASLFHPLNFYERIPSVRLRIPTRILSKLRVLIRTVHKCGEFEALVEELEVDVAIQ
jgi:hypothetical protein